MRYINLLFIISLISCQNTLTDNETTTTSTIAYQEKKAYNIGGITADNKFDGARLNDFIQIDDTTFQAVIEPENTPINISPWYAFRLQAEEEKNITLQLKYTEHRHRYVPKLSNDGKNWEAIDTSLVEIDTSNATASFPLQLSTAPLWVAAQEVINSTDMQNWMKTYTHLPYVTQKTIGKSVLGKDIYSLEFAFGENQPALVLIGRQHPPELPGATLAMQAFVDELNALSDLSQKFRQKYERCNLKCHFR